MEEATQQKETTSVLVPYTVEITKVFRKRIAPANTAFLVVQSKKISKHSTVYSNYCLVRHISEEQKAEIAAKLWEAVVAKYKNA